MRKKKVEAEEEEIEEEPEEEIEEADEEVEELEEAEEKRPRGRPRKEPIEEDEEEELEEIETIESLEAQKKKIEERLKQIEIEERQNKFMQGLPDKFEAIEKSVGILTQKVIELEDNFKRLIEQ